MKVLLTGSATTAAACRQAIEMLNKAASPPAIVRWGDASVAILYDEAVAVSEGVLELGKLERAGVVDPITTADYPTQSQTETELARQEPSWRPNVNLEEGVDERINVFQSCHQSPDRHRVD
jgi:hypothetical protein